MVKVAHVGDNFTPDKNDMICFFSKVSHIIKRKYAPNETPKALEEQTNNGRQGVG